MEQCHLQDPLWHQGKKGLLSQDSLQSRGSHSPQSQIRNIRNCRRGFFEIEMLIWVSVILLIAQGFLSIHKIYSQEHEQVQEDFQREWDKLNT